MTDYGEVEDPEAEAILVELREVAQVIKAKLADLAIHKTRRMELWLRGRDLDIQQQVLAKAGGVTPSGLSQNFIAHDSKSGE